jgi:hypothetical protein
LKKEEAGDRRKDKTGKRGEVREEGVETLNSSNGALSC